MRATLDPMNQQPNVSHLMDILIYLREGSQRLDAEIVAATGISLDDVRAALAILSRRGDISVCHTTRFTGGMKTEGMLCRANGLERTTAVSRRKNVKP
jgi:transcription initiation factor IIE alpha subunit